MCYRGFCRHFRKFQGISSGFQRRYRGLCRVSEELQKRGGGVALGGAYWFSNCIFDHCSQVSFRGISKAF